MSTIAQAKAIARGEGWTVSGNRKAGYIVSQLGERRIMTQTELLAFSGLTNPSNN